MADLTGKTLDFAAYNTNSQEPVLAQAFSNYSNQANIPCNIFVSKKTQGCFQMCSFCNRGDAVDVIFM